MASAAHAILDSAELPVQHDRTATTTSFPAPAPTCATRSFAHVLRSSTRFAGQEPGYGGSFSSVYNENNYSFFEVGPLMFMVVERGVRAAQGRRELGQHRLIQNHPDCRVIISTHRHPEQQRRARGGLRR